MLHGPPQVYSYSQMCAGEAHQRAGGGTMSTSASAVWSAADYIQIIGMRLDYPFWVRSVYALLGATVGTDSWAVGVYSADLSSSQLLVASASTLHAGSANSIQTVAVASPVRLPPGRYWLAMGCSGTTATFFQVASTVDRAMAGEVFEQTAAYSAGMPQTITPVLLNTLKTFVFGISQGSVV